MIGKINYEKIQTIFNNNASLLSMNKVQEFFNTLPEIDRMEVETFLRTELGINVFDYITVIPKGMFMGNQDLTNIIIPSTIMDIEAAAFESCAAKAIKIEAPITVIKESTFQGCSELQNIELPEGLTKIGSFAFKGCSSLKEISLPDSIQTLEDNVFTGTPLDFKINISKKALANISLDCYNAELSWYQEKGRFNAI